MSLTLGIALALSAALSGHVPAALSVNVQAPPMPASQTVEGYVREYFADIPVMIAIAECESHFRQHDENGSILRGSKVKEDVGVMQINEYFHKEMAEKLGLDLNTIEGNVSYARHLYEKEGVRPWSASKRCWSKKSNHLALAN